MSTGAATKNILWKQTPDFILESKETEIVLSKGEEKLYLNLCKYDKNSKIPKNEYTKWFDYDKIMDTLTVRTQQESDFIQINAAGVITSYSIHYTKLYDARCSSPVCATPAK